MNADQRRRLLRPAAWLALVAMFGLALLPSISHALTASRGGATWAEVCTPQGMRLVAVDTADAAGEPAKGSMPATAHLEHCPFCGGASACAATPPVAPTLPLPSGLSHAVPWLFLHAPATMHAWRTAQPRGPPSFLH